MARKRVLSIATSEAALSAAKACRAAAIQVLTEAPISSPAYHRASELLGAIDALAEALTGDQRLFHTKPHPAG
jgi:hypothetical protein